MCLLQLLLQKLYDVNAICELEILILLVEDCFPNLSLNNPTYWISIALFHSTNLSKLSSILTSKAEPLKTQPKIVSLVNLL